MGSRQYTQIEIHPDGRIDPTKSRMRCEAPGCVQEFVVADAYSVVAVAWALTGPDVRFSSQCPQEQHFACSPTCLRACLVECFDHHLLPLHRERLAAQTGAQP